MSGFADSFRPVPLRLAGGAGAVAALPAALAWFDIVGFTAIARRHLARGQDGIEALGRLLERHYADLLARIVDEGGEPLLFAGDGLLCRWTVGADGPEAAMRRAAQCAEAVMAARAAPEGARPASPAGSPEGDPLLYAVLTHGECRIVEVGDGEGRLPVTLGSGVRDLQVTARARAAGEVVLSPAAAALLEAAETVPDGRGASRLRALRHRLPPVPLRLPAPEGGDDGPPGARRDGGPGLAWRAELRRVTAVFVNLATLDGAEPDAADRLEAVAARILAVLRRHEGRLLPLHMDEAGITFPVLFGIPPAAHADAAARALRCALDLEAALAAAGERSAVGVATGPVFYGLIGNDVLRSDAAIGDAMNLSARLMRLRGDGLRCDEATRRAAGEGAGLAFAPLGQARLRGFAEALSLFEPRRGPPAPREGGPAPGGGQGQPPGGAATPEGGAGIVPKGGGGIVPEIGASIMPEGGAARPARPAMQGRQAEMVALFDALAATAGAAAPVLVTLEGESGMGKSRLLGEFERRAVAGGARVLRGAADRIERRLPYRGWRGIVESLLGLDGLEEPAWQATALRALGPELAPHGALLDAVLPLGLPETPRSLALPRRVEALAALLLALLGRAAEAGPLVLAIDDAQWLDEASRALVATVAESTLPLCLLLAMQPPEDEALPVPVLRVPPARRLVLGGLSEAEQERLVLDRLGGERLTPALAALIGDRARGHPYFCAELAQALREEGVIEVAGGTCGIARHVDLDRLPLPDTLQGTVLRRLDRLDPESQLTLKVASAAGLRFPTALVVDIHPAHHAEAAVSGHLSRHSRLRLLLRDWLDESEGYAFRHGLIRDVAYGLMLPSQRRQLHRDMAGWYERRDAAQRARVYGLLAYHLEAAGENVRAAEYLLLEARRVFSLGLARESVSIGLHGIDLLGVTLPVLPAAIGPAIGAEMARIGVLLAGRPPAALRALPALAEPDMLRLIGGLLAIAPLAFQSEQLELFALLGITALRLTLEHGNAPFAADVYAMYGIVLGAMTGDRHEALAWSRLALALAEDGPRDSFARCAFIHLWFHAHWEDTLDAGIALAGAGAEAGLGHGEVLYGCFNLSGQVILMAARGHALAAVMERARAHLARNAGRVQNAAFHLRLELQFAKALAGLTTSPLEMTDAEFDEAQDLASICDTTLSNQIAYYHVARAKLHALLGDWEGALAPARRARAMLPAFAGQTAEFELAQFQGIAALALAGAGDAAALAEGRLCAGLMRGWAARNPALFGHKADLLEALLRHAEGGAASAPALLEQAAARAEAAGFAQDAALAWEHAARCRRTAGDSAGAGAAAARAVAAYEAWGAAALAAPLRREAGPAAG
ncbi:AAA family ATPase [Roseomonas acroporae]|uniref:AAA family ATPase n=1 Tax=Roseomonas acroporae TaxID=2937791 RepID=UPI0024A74E8D|nr:AAA family ATPase [Roseomonas acroporae]